MQILLTNDDGITAPGIQALHAALEGLGEVIIAGLLSNNTAFVLQGGLVTALMAILLYDGMRLLEQRFVPVARN